MKKVLYYTIIGKFSPKVMAVTSEKRFQIYGRWAEDDSSTHTTKFKSHGKFKTVELADQAIASIRQCWVLHDQMADPLKKQLDALHHSAMEQVNRIIQLAGGTNDEYPGDSQETS